MKKSQTQRVYSVVFRKTLCYLFLIFSIVCAACEQENDSFEIQNFNPISNYPGDGRDTIEMQMDLSQGILDGIYIPSDTLDEPFFLISFQIKNTGIHPSEFYYKVFYQNESYKFEESHSRAVENFYGSWHNGNRGFRSTKTIPPDGQFHTVVDTLRIMGNPRNEERYFGELYQPPPVTNRELGSALENIKKNSEWVQDILKKAKDKKIPVSDQMIEEAKWIVSQGHLSSNPTSRWKRNPRAGVYGFSLVVADDKSIALVPDYIKDISVKDTASGSFVHPYKWIEDHVDLRNLCFVKATNFLRTFVRFDPLQGVFVDESDVPQKLDDAAMDATCGKSPELYKSAHFEQFIHHESYKHYFNNIPKAVDVVGEGYSRRDYTRDSTRFHKEGWSREDESRDSQIPCSTVSVDSVDGALLISNPGVESGIMKKENVGVNTRIGFTYGKFRAKLEFPEIVSSDFVWNGLTCAFWLYYQEDSEWNNRQLCEGGYIPKGSSDKYNRHDSNPYSEIDIEIVKTSKYWPQSSYGHVDNFPVDNALNENVIITCTNWDLACPSPADYSAGVQEIEYLDKVFTGHRWDDWYKALTIKTEYPQDKTLGDVFYYEIEWRPEEIIWRIGPDEQNMEVIGYMDASQTSIPNNQMLAVITQEFHHGTWWPTARFQQGLIPYPKRDLTGYIHEIVVE